MTSLSAYVFPHLFIPWILIIAFGKSCFRLYTKATGEGSNFRGSGDVRLRRVEGSSRFGAPAGDDKLDIKLRHLGLQVGADLMTDLIDRLYIMILLCRKTRVHI